MNEKEESDYSKFRGKCRELCDEAVKNNPTLTLVRGHYWCPFWGMQPHWWCVKPNGEIFDPSVKQFPSKGIGREYIPFDDMVTCAYCGEEIAEETASIDGNYAFCSYRCHSNFVGIFV